MNSGPNLGSNSVNPAFARAGKFKDFRRALIVTAAETVFAEKGLEGASMRAIAAEAGCTTGAIYPFFDGKEALYAEVLGKSLERLADHMAGAAKAARKGRARALAAMRGFYSYYAERPHELSMGLYLFNAGARRGVGKGRDSQLNDALLTALRIIDRALVDELDLAPERAAALRNRAFVSLIGLLIAENAGRMRPLGARAPRLLEDMIADLVPTAKG